MLLHSQAQIQAEISGLETKVAALLKRNTSGADCFSFGLASMGSPVPKPSSPVLKQSSTETS